jgi:sulfate transport system permease protein
LIQSTTAPAKVRSVDTENRIARWTLLMAVAGLPRSSCFCRWRRSSSRPSARALGAFFEALQDAETRSAIRLTLLVAAISVPLNLVFGVAAAWAIAKFEFKGKAFLTP